MNNTILNGAKTNYELSMYMITNSGRLNLLDYISVAYKVCALRAVTIREFGRQNYKYDMKVFIDSSDSCLNFICNKLDVTPIILKNMIVNYINKNIGLNQFKIEGSM